MDFALIKRLTVSQRRAPRKRRSGRDAQGVYLLELLVALVVSGIVSFALLQTLSTSMTALSTSANDTYADEILDVLSEQTRVYGYERLVLFPGEQTLLLNKYEVGEVGPSFNKRPLLLDFVKKQWQSKTRASLPNATISYSVESGTVADSLIISMSVQWSDSRESRVVRRSVVVFK